MNAMPYRKPTLLSNKGARSAIMMRCWLSQLRVEISLESVLQTDLCTPAAVVVAVGAHIVVGLFHITFSILSIAVEELELSVATVGNRAVVYRCTG